MPPINETVGPSHFTAPRTDRIPLEGRGPDKAAESFESFFLYYMLKVMRETVPKSGLFGNSPGEELYVSLLDEQVAQGIAARGGLGLSDMLLKEITVVEAREGTPRFLK